MLYIVIALLAAFALYLFIRQRQEFMDLVKMIAIVLSIVVPIRTFLYNQYYVPSGSMVPTLLEGDHVGVTMFAYGFGRFALPFDIPLWNGRFFAEDPERGDIAVFQHPSDPKIDLIKRVVGLPGDKIQLVNGQLLINNEPVPTRFLQGVDLAENSDIWRKRLSFLEEKFGDKPHFIANAGPGFADNTRVYQVPESHFFALGDNRDHSTDSRFRHVGYAPMNNLIGRADIILASRKDGRKWFLPWHWFDLFRGDRFFKILQ